MVELAFAGFNPLFLALLLVSWVWPFCDAVNWARHADVDDHDALRLRNYLLSRQYRGQPEYYGSISSQHERHGYGIQSEPQPAFRFQHKPSQSFAVVPEENEIDTVKKEEDELVAGHERQSLSAQGERVPEMAQELPPNSMKQQRAPQQPVAQAHSQDSSMTKPNGKPSFNFIMLVAGCSGAALFGVVSAGFCWYKLQKNAKASAEAEYPAYGVTGPSKDHPSPPSGDRKLAQSAQMYHYQHQKQQMIAIEKASSDRHVSTSDLDSEEENEEGDYTVYECPGLAPTGEMEVKNPLFQDEPTPASPATKDPEK